MACSRSACSCDVARHVALDRRPEHQGRPVDQLDHVTGGDRVTRLEQQVRVELDAPVSAELVVGDRPVDRRVAGVQQHHEVVVDDPATVRVDRRDGLAVEEHADGSCIAVLPVVVRHRLTVRPEPGEVLDVADLAALEPSAPAERRVVAAERGDAPRPLEQILVDGAPVEPRDLVVLAVRVVVPLLRAPDLIPTEQHRHTLRQQQRGQQVAALAGPQGEDRRVVGRPLDAAVPRAVVGLAVAVVLAVRVVVLLVVRDEVGQREAVVGGDEVDRRGRSSGVGLVEVGAPREAGAELRQRRRLAAPEVADRVAVAAVPLGPLRREVADLVAALADVPGLGDQLDL